MAITFNPIERRVLGVLIEKSMTQPEYYPMTANAIVAACNQKSNREPVLNLSEPEVVRLLETLGARGLARLTSSASRKVVKMGPFSRVKALVDGLNAFVPIMSVGERSAVN